MPVLSKFNHAERDFFFFKQVQAKSALLTAESDQKKEKEEDRRSVQHKNSYLFLFFPFFWINNN